MTKVGLPSSWSLRTFRRFVVGSWAFFSKFVEVVGRYVLHRISRALDRLAWRWRKRFASGLEIEFTAAERAFARRAALPAAALLTFTAITTLLAASQYRSGTAYVTARHFSGVVEAYVDDPAASVQVEITLWNRVNASIDDFDGTLFKIGDNAARALELDLTVTHATSSGVRWAVLLSEDARFRDLHVIGNNAKVQDVKVFSIANSESGVDEYPSCPCQLVTGRFAGGLDGAKIGGIPLGAMWEKAGATTSLNMPTFADIGSGSEIELSGLEATLPAIRLYGPKENDFIVRVGDPPAGTSVDASPPLSDRAAGQFLNFAAGPWKQWEGREIAEAHALFTNADARQQQSNQLFAAGVLGGVAGGFLVESLLRIRGIIELGRSSGPQPILPRPNAKRMRGLVQIPRPRRMGRLQPRTRKRK